MPNINSFPNNSDIYQGAEEVMRWLHGRTKGVYGGSGNAAVTVANAMSVEVSPGVGWITDADSNGVCWWFDSAIELTIDNAESTGTLDRIDRVIIEWQTTDYAALPEVKILKGTSSSTATPPALTNNSAIRQISLAQVSIPAGTTTLTPALITDERYDPTVCGIVTESVSFDSTTINEQFQAFLAAIEQELEELEAGTAVELKKKQFNNTSVPTSAFVADQTYEDYGYRAAVALTGVIATDIPEVMFGMAEAISGNFAPVAASYDGGVYIYSSDVPDAAITIPTIICWRGNA